MPLWQRAHGPTTSIDARFLLPRATSYASLATAVITPRSAIDLALRGRSEQFDLRRLPLRLALLAWLGAVTAQHKNSRNPPLRRRRTRS